MGKPTELDRLYGLDPVIEPGEAAGSDALEQFTGINCPYCAEMIELRLDLSGGEQSYIEDCHVCCQPILIRMRVSLEGELIDVAAERTDR